MAHAHIVLNEGKTYTRGAIVYRKGEIRETTDAREINWAKRCGFMSCVDLEEAAREAARALAAAKAKLASSKLKKAAPVAEAEEILEEEDESFAISDEELEKASEGDA